MAREISINRKGKAGLTGMEIDEVIATLKKAKARGILPSLTYKYNPRTWLYGKDPIYAKPKSASLQRTGVLIRRILKAQFGGKYTVRLV